MRSESGMGEGRRASRISGGWPLLRLRLSLRISPATSPGPFPTAPFLGASRKPSQNLLCTSLIGDRQRGDRIRCVAFALSVLPQRLASACQVANFNLTVRPRDAAEEATSRWEEGGAGGDKTEMRAPLALRKWLWTCGGGGGLTAEATPKPPFETTTLQQQTPSVLTPARYRG
ncbi:hypothetical protein K402DRAFT_103129 [Aulographum hederae CBS 113979]|uniref:Uncharacterized protein n=1 Tax=Aulographum hederae CBS 113979 TaxID=1176131 RepID=A0A6G1GXH3_9PEZI|nr:hypothetical protein K402DRAFT_103129 [Aulographum hederae CBS 113979]